MSGQKSLRALNRGGCVICLIALALFISYVDRGHLATAAPMIWQELGLSAIRSGSSVERAGVTLIGAHFIGRQNVRADLLQRGGFEHGRGLYRGAAAVRLPFPSLRRPRRRAPSCPPRRVQRGGSAGFHRWRADHGSSRERPDMIEAGICDRCRPIHRITPRAPE